AGGWAVRGAGALARGVEGAVAGVSLAAAGTASGASDVPGACGCRAQALSTSAAHASQKAFTGLPYIDLLPDLQVRPELVPAFQGGDGRAVALGDRAQGVAGLDHVHRARGPALRDRRRVHERQVGERSLGAVVDRHHQLGGHLRRGRVDAVYALELGEADLEALGDGLELFAALGLVHLPGDQLRFVEV